MKRSLAIGLAALAAAWAAGQTTPAPRPPAGPGDFDFLEGIEATRAP